MNLYKLGLAEPGSELLLRSGYQVGVGALVATPAAIRDEAIRLNTDIESMDAELGRERKSWPPNDANPNGQLSPHQTVMDRWYEDVWTPFLREWAKWFSDHGRTWGLRMWWENLWGSAWTQAQDYRRRLLDMRESASKVGYGFRGPAPQPPVEGAFSAAASEIWKVVKAIIYVALFVAGGFLVLRVVEVGKSS